MHLRFALIVSVEIIYALYIMHICIYAYYVVGKSKQGTFMKSFLKLARESISSKDFESALNYADNGLESDEVTEGEKASSNKYNLLVFKALSLHNLGRDKEAIESYELAGMIHPELALAWQVFFCLVNA